MLDQFYRISICTFLSKASFIYSHSQGVPLISSEPPAESVPLIGQKKVTRARFELVQTVLFLVVKTKSDDGH